MMMMLIFNLDFCFCGSVHRFKVDYASVCVSVVRYYKKRGKVKSLYVEIWVELYEKPKFGN